MKIVVVNAPALRSSGGLSIFKDFLSFLYKEKDKEFIFHVLTSTKELFNDADNIIIHEMPVQSWMKRIIWDKKGFQDWCEKNCIIPDVLISLQNTCPNMTGKYKDVKKIVYFHQLLAISSYHWKLYRPKEVKLFLYAHLYGFFVNRWNSNTDYIVQLDIVKKLFCKKFTNIEQKKVHVIRPNLPLINVKTIVAKEICNQKKIFIYPAANYEYKNHKILLDAVRLLKNEYTNLEDKIQIIFTIPEDDSITKNVYKKGIESIVKCINSITYEELLSYYKRCDCLLFPSKIESFGLPLVEAALFGKPIIAADLPYAREVLKEYDGAMFADINEPQLWMQYIKDVLQFDMKYKSLTQNKNNTWNELMEIINS